MDLLTNASLLQDSIKFVAETKLKQNLSNKKENNTIDSNSDIQGLTEDNSDQSDNRTIQSSLLNLIYSRDLPFWIWNQSEHKKTRYY